MATRNARTATRKPTAPKASANGTSTLGFAEVSDDDFPTVSRTSTKLEVYMDDAEALAEGKRGAYPIETKEEAMKVAAQLRQVLRRWHKQSLTAVYVANEKRLYVRSNGDYKERGPRQPKEEVSTETKTTARNAVSKSRNAKR